MKTFYHSLRVRRTVVGLLLLTVAVVAGCRPTQKKATLTGKVIYKGKPVTGGSITLFPSDEKLSPVNGDIKPDGTYEVFAPPVGENKVTISTDSARGMTGSAYPMANMPTPPPGVEVKMPDVDASKMPKYVDIPQLYKDKSTTKLKCTINAGPNTQDFTLTD